MPKSSGSPVSRRGRPEKSVTIVSTWTAVLCAADGLAGRAVREQQVVERALRRAVGLVAGRRRIREVVRDLVLPDLLSEHSRRGDVEPAVHSDWSSAATRHPVGRGTGRLRTDACCCRPSCRGDAARGHVGRRARAVARREPRRARDRGDPAHRHAARGDRQDRRDAAPGRERRDAGARHAAARGGREPGGSTSAAACRPSAGNGPGSAEPNDRSAARSARGSR